MHSHCYPYENPGPSYSRRGMVIHFDNGRSYRINHATVHEAAYYLAHTVKIAEHEGRRIPRGPHGLTPGAAAVLIHFGRTLLAKKPAKKRRAPAKRRSAPAPRPRATAAPRSTTATVRQEIPDFWDRTTEVYSLGR